MLNRQRQNHALAFKAKTPPAAVRNEGSLSALSKRFNMHPTQITSWKELLLAAAPDVFPDGHRPADPPVDVKTLHAEIGQSPWRTIL